LVPFFYIQQQENKLARLPFDPITVPVESIAGETPLAAERLAIEWLRTRFTTSPDWTPEITNRHLLDDPSARFTSAAVLFPIVAREQGLTLLLTQRTAHLNDHAGQVSLPGGRVEPIDASSIETALRETEEEVGLNRRHIEVLGTLPEYFTGTGYRITPVVSIVHPPFDLCADPYEVAEIFEVPLSFLMNGMHHQRRTAEFPNGLGRHTFYAMPYEGYFIWGATADMLRNLFHFLRA
jgi:8-oxo-dGTP pyrophosphatase MutT (NUDIX family)